MQTITLKIRDDYVEKIINFLKLLPENVAKVEISSDKEEINNELISRIEDIENKRVKTISREELFNEF